MTNWEFRAKLVFLLMKALNIKLRDLYDSYPYNPYSDTEVDAFWSDLERNYVAKHW